ncbi:Translation initiation factor eIF-2B subunit beta [Toxocara canis]|uniref:Translation initiation factor eIF2B subunit beta n=1 Tax=Toxocara canis TaxID=6265 RepID=A0A0B2UYB1_TOXCA|nr:Translation initiation factor eIF-2B subunit beta [Toxocara canis]
MSSRSSASDELMKHRKGLLARLRTKSKRETSFKIAVESLNFMRMVVVTGKYDNVEQLIELLKRERERLVAAEPSEFVISNVVLSVLKMIREECERATIGSDDFNPYDSLNKLWNAPSTGDKEIGSRSLRKSAVAAINEFATEMETCRENMCAQAVDHICSSDVVITHALSRSETLRAFFDSARAAHRSFRLLSLDDDCEHAEYLSSVDVLSAMRHATRVIIAAAALLPDGSCIAPAGSLMMCLAAKRHSVPVSVCAAFYKVTPCFLPNIDVIPSMGSPSEFFPFSESDSMSEAYIVNPLFDLIPAQLVSLYISHTSAISPSHVYRLIGDYYHPDDINNVNT